MRHNRRRTLRLLQGRATSSWCMQEPTLHRPVRPNPPGRNQLFRLLLESNASTRSSELKPKSNNRHPGCGRSLSINQCGDPFDEYKSAVELCRDAAVKETVILGCDYLKNSTPCALVLRR